MTAPPQGEDRSPVLNLVAEKEAQLQQWKETAGQLRSSLEKTRAELERTKASARALRKERDTLVAEDSLLRESLATVDAERRDLLERMAERELAELRRERAQLEDELIRVEAFGDDPFAEERVFEGEEEDELALDGGAEDDDAASSHGQPGQKASNGGHDDSSH